MVDAGGPPPPDGDVDRGHIIVALYCSECAVALIVVALRLYSRLLIKKLGVDNWVILFTMVCNVRHSGKTFAAVGLTKFTIFTLDGLHTDNAHGT